MALARTLGLQGPSAWVRTELAQCLFQLGDWDEALRLVDQVTDWTASNDSEDTEVVDVERIRALIRTFRGELDDARRSVQTLLDAARRMDDPLVTEEALTAAATFSLMTDALPAALEYVQALDRMPDHGMYSGTFLPDRVRILLAAGRHDQARKAVHEDTVATHRPGCHLNARALLAEADRQTEQAEQAAELYRQAAHQLRGGPVLERAQALHGQGRCLQQASHPGSQDALRDAEALLSNLGAHHLTRQLDALLHGHTPIRRTQTI